MPFLVTMVNVLLFFADILFQKKRLEILLGQATVEEPIVILLDGLDQLKDINDYKLLSLWLPINLPNNVKIVISFNTDSSSFQKIFSEFKYLIVLKLFKFP